MSVRKVGPLFDGRAEREVNVATREMQQAISLRGVELIKQRLTRVLKHPTGKYMSKIQPNATGITDSGIIYGPWLEGIGSRNRTTRFKGYATFKITAPLIQAQSGPIADSVIRRHIGGMQ